MVTCIAPADGLYSDAVDQARVGSDSPSHRRTSSLLPRLPMAARGITSVFVKRVLVVCLCVVRHPL